jgi:hypothetical protein
MHPRLRGLSVPLWVVALCGMWAATGHATIVVLQDLNSVATFSTQTQGGQQGWQVDGTSQLFQQWFWYRIGNAAEQSLDSLPQTGLITSDTNFNPGNDHMVVQYTGAPLRITTTYSLVGSAPGTGNSDLGEQIKVENQGATPLDFHFFQYVDFDLNGTPNDDVVSFLNANAVLQQDSGGVLSETVNTALGASSTHREVNLYPNTLNSLNDTLPTTLNDNLGPIGPGDVTWAFQWDFTIGVGGSVTISKDKLLAVPEPSSLALVIAVGCLFPRRFRRPKHS